MMQVNFANDFVSSIIKRVLMMLFIAFVLCNICFGGYSQEVLQDNPVGWWRFDDYYYKDGFAVKEMTGNIAGSTFQGDAMITDAGIDGKSCWFNGNQAGIDIGNDLGELLDQSSAITFEAWINNAVPTDTTLTQRIFATRIDGGKAGLDVGIYNNSTITRSVRVAARSTTNDPYTTVSADFLAGSQWVHLVGVVDFTGKRVKIYIDGEKVLDASVGFGSDVYTLGEPTQTDQIGRAPDITVPYRGYIDEVAVYNHQLTPDRIQAHFNAGNPQEPGSLWVSQIAYQDPASGRMIGSPSLLKYDDGVLLSKYDYWGDSYFKVSYNDGQSWMSRSRVDDFVMGTLFEHQGNTYIFGISRNPGHITISKSTNYGGTWSETSVLFEAQEPGVYGYHTGPVPVLNSNGKIYRVFEERVSNERWPIAYAAVVVWADEDSDLLDPASWTITNAVEFDPAWANPEWNCTSPGWLEGNVVEAPSGEVVVLMRYHTNPVVDKAAILTLSNDDTVLSFDPQTGFIDMPGGMHKFDIHRDPVTGKYLTLNNNNTDPARPAQRNTLSLVASDDLVNWEHVRTLVQDNSTFRWWDSMVNVGFQYVVWLPDGDDIIYMSRTSYDGAIDYHDSNRMTFHRLENYLDFVAPCGDWGYAAADLNKDCVVDISDFAVVANQWLLCTKPYIEGCYNADN